jgi:hypothetical protein
MGLVGDGPRVEKDAFKLPVLRIKAPGSRETTSSTGILLDFEAVVWETAGPLGLGHYI